MTRSRPRQRRTAAPPRPARRAPPPAATAPAAGRAGPRAVAAAAALALYPLVGLAGLAAAFHPTLASGFARMQTDPGDPLFTNYLLEHYVRLATRPGYAGRLWSPPFFYPAQQVLAYSENLLGVAPLYGALRLACSPTLAHQLLTMLALALTFGSMAFVLRRLGAGHPLAALGGFCFAFGMWRVVQISHLQLLVAYWAPLALLAVRGLFVAPSRRGVAAALALLYLQILSSIYLGWFLLLGMGLFACLYGLVDGGARQRLLAFWRGHAAFVSLAVAVWLAATYLTLAPYVAAGREVGVRSWEVVKIFLPRPQSWLAVPEGSLYGGFLRPFPPDTPVLWEHLLFPGFVVLGLGLLSARHLLRHGGADRAGEGEPPGDDEDERAAGRALLLACWGTALALVLLSLYLPIGHGRGLSLWRIVYYAVPGAGAIRAVGRIASVVYLFGLVAVFVGAQQAICRLDLRPPGRRALLALLLVAGMADQSVRGLPSFEKGPFLEQVERTRSAIPPGCPAAYVRLRADQPFFVSQLAAMWAGLEANVPVINGYSGNSPPGYPDPTRTMSEAQLEHWFGGKKCVVR